MVQLSAFVYDYCDQIHPEVPNHRLSSLCTKSKHKKRSINSKLKKKNPKIKISKIIIEQEIYFIHNLFTEINCKCDSYFQVIRCF